MSMTAAQYQKQQDDAAELELDMERIEQDMREILLAGDEFPLTYHRVGAMFPVTEVYDRDDVVTAMVELDDNAFNKAVMMTRTNPTEAAKILTQLMAKAVEQIIGLAPIREAAEFQEDVAA